MQIAQRVAGYTLGEADMLRRAMGKKDKEKMAKEKDRFIERGTAAGFDGRRVADLFDTIEYFAGYGFNKSHSAAYAAVAYETAYLKANFPVEFMAGLLSTKSGRTDDIVKYVQDCRERGIQVLGPDINASHLDFTITGERQIRFGFAAVKGLGEAALEAILGARAAEGGFKDFFHALKSTDLQRANRKVWESLIKAGAFDSLEPNRAALLAGLPDALSAAAPGPADLGMSSLFDDAEMASLSAGWSLPEEVEPMHRRDRLRAEKETLGLYVSGHPLDEYADILKVHTVGSIAALHRAVQEGRLKEGDEVAIGAMVSDAAFKTTKRGEPMAILKVEDALGKLEVLLMASAFNPVTKQRTRPFEAHRHRVEADALLRIKGELKVERMAGSAAAESEGEEDEQEVLKIFAHSLEPLEGIQGQGFSGALVRLPAGECPPRLFAMLGEFPGSLPVYFDFKSREGLTARVKAGPDLKLRHDPDLADRVHRETGCALSWMF